MAGKHCDHKNLVKDKVLGSYTGDWVCADCGRDIKNAQGNILQTDYKK